MGWFNHQLVVHWLKPFGGQPFQTQARRAEKRSLTRAQAVLQAAS